MREAKEAFKVYKIIVNNFHGFENGLQKIGRQDRILEEWGNLKSETK